MTDVVGALPANRPIMNYDDLALALGGSGDSFTGHLLLLIAKADLGNRARLRRGFPRQVAAWEIWQGAGLGDLTAGDVATALATIPDASGRLDPPQEVLDKMAARGLTELTAPDERDRD